MMTEYDNHTEYPKSNKATLPQSQNWGLMIGVGVVMLGLLVMIVNLSIYETRPTLLAAVPATPRPFWVQVGRLAGLVASLGAGGWLLWRLFRQQQNSRPAYLATPLQQAVNYTRKIEEMLKNGSNGHEQQLLLQIQTWQQTIETMAQVLANLGQNDQIIQNDLRYLPGAVTDLEQQVAAETNPLLRSDLEQMLKQRQNQQKALEQLQTTRRRAEIHIERTIAVLGTIYSQLLTYRSTFHVVDYQHLADNVAEEVQHLQDYLEALQEVKGSR
jgi:hypothetical protein